MSMYFNNSGAAIFRAHHETTNKAKETFSGSNNELISSIETNVKKNAPNDNIPPTHNVHAIVVPPDTATCLDIKFSYTLTKFNQNSSKVLE